MEFQSPRKLLIPLSPTSWSSPANNFAPKDADRASDTPEYNTGRIPQQTRQQDVITPTKVNLKTPFPENQADE